MPVLKAFVDGQWVRLAGGSSGGAGVDEVWIGPDQPVDAATELWVDSDAANLSDPNVARWNSAWGVVGSATYATAQNGITTPATDLTGLSVTFTPVTGRRYRASFAGVMYANGAAVMDINIMDASNALIGAINGNVAAGFVPWPQFFTALFSPPGGVPYTVRARASMNTSSVNTAPSAANPMRLIVEDMGPTAPASNPPVQPASVWTTATYQNGWVSLDDRPVQYRKVGDEVQMRGVPYNGTQGWQIPIVTLPVGFRPPTQSLAFPVACQGGVATVSVFSSGIVSVSAASPATLPAGAWLYIDPVRFSVSA